MSNMYDSDYDEELSKQIDKLKTDCKWLDETATPFKNGFESALPDTPGEDYNTMLSVSAFFARRRIKKSQKRPLDKLLKDIRDNNMTMIAQAVHFDNPITKYNHESFPSLIECAVSYNNPVALKLLLDHQFTFGDKCPQSIGKFLLPALVEEKKLFGEYPCAKTLVRVGADVLQTDSNGESALMKIIKNDMVDIFDNYHVFHVINKNSLTTEGEPILLYAAKYAGNEIISDLMNYDFNIRDKNPKQENILHILAKRANKTEFIQKAIEKGADINAVDILGNTPLHYGAQNAQDKNVEILLNAGAYPLIKNNNQQTPMDVLAANSSTQYQSIAKISMLLSTATSKIYQELLEKNQPSNPSAPTNAQHITSQKPPHPKGGDQHTPE